MSLGAQRLVLLDDQPAAVVPAAERGDDRLDVDVALAERAEHAALEGRLEALVVTIEPRR